MKVCTKCKINKEETFFSKDSSKGDGLYSSCKECVKAYHHNYYKENRDTILINSKLYAIENPEKVSQKNKKNYRDNKKRYAKNHRIYEKNKIKNDLSFKLGKNLRGRIRSMLGVKNNYKGGSAVRDLGCNIIFLRWHLESQFLPGMSWDNYGLYGWHIDHIIPLSLFDLTDRKQFLKACHYTNLQPLWAEENWSKRNKII